MTVAPPLRRRLHTASLAPLREVAPIAEPRREDALGRSPYPLYQAVRRWFLDRVQKGALMEDNRIPSEAALAVELGVSRTTVREALLAMEQDGYLTRKHGVGTFVHPSALQAKARIDLITRFTDLIRAAGFERVRVEARHAWTRLHGGEGARAGFADGEAALRLARVFYGDDQPVIFTVTFIPRGLVRREVTAGPDHSFFGLVADITGEDVTHQIAWFRARAADEEIAAALRLPLGEPVFAWSEVHYNLSDKAICQSESCFNVDLLPLCAMRRAPGR